MDIGLNWFSFLSFIDLVFVVCVCACLVASVLSDSLQPYRLQPTGLRCSWDSPDKNT